MGLNGFVFGIEGLDKIFRDALQPPLVLVVAGHPGSGKTTFSSTVCYTNALVNNVRCLYISFQEDKEKFYRLMKHIGMDFSIAEEKGLFSFMKIPITLDVDAVIETISKLISGFQPKVVVVDSINAVLQGAKDEEKRAWIQNYFYELSKAIQGTVILVAELPFGEEKISLGSIEFIADAIFVLKHRIEGGFLSRHIEVRKIRGAPVMLAEIPFTIGSSGLKVWIPPILSEIKYSNESISLYCRTLKNILGYIIKGSVIYVEYPPDQRVADVALIPLAIACANNLKTLVISYRYPPSILKHLITEALAKISIDEEKAMTILRTYLHFKDINPFSQSLTQLYAEEIEYITNYKPDLVVFHGVEILASAVDKDMYIPKLYNELNTLKSLGCTIVRFSSYINDELSRTNAALSDVVIRILPTDTGSGEQNYRLYVWRKGRKAYVMSYEEVLECLQELGNLIKSMCLSTQTSKS